jgi:hypothetical protein
LAAIFEPIPHFKDIVLIFHSIIQFHKMLHFILNLKFN